MQRSRKIYDSTYCFCCQRKTHNWYEKRINWTVHRRYLKFCYLPCQHLWKYLPELSQQLWKRSHRDTLWPSHTGWQHFQQDWGLNWICRPLPLPIFSTPRHRQSLKLDQSHHKFPWIHQSLKLSTCHSKTLIDFKAHFHEAHLELTKSRNFTLVESGYGKPKLVNDTFSHIRAEFNHKDNICKHITTESTAPATYAAGHATIDSIIQQVISQN